jgi:hypothetical protein
MQIKHYIEFSMSVLFPKKRKLVGVEYPTILTASSGSEVLVNYACLFDDTLLFIRINLEL